MLQSIHPLSLIELTIAPSVFAYTLRFTIDVLSIVNTAIRKLLEAKSLLVITLPITFIDTLILIQHNAPPMSLAIDYISVVG